MLESYIPIFIMIGIGILMGVAMGNVNVLLGPRRPSEEKQSTYESGMEPVRSARERFPIKFYMVAMLFIIFDIELVFVWPWAMLYRSLGWFGFAEMMVFLGILMLGFLYVWRKGGLEWE